MTWRLRSSSGGVSVSDVRSAMCAQRARSSALHGSSSSSSCSTAAARVAAGHRRQPWQPPTDPPQRPHPAGPRRHPPNPAHEHRGASTCSPEPPRPPPTEPVPPPPIARQAHGQEQHTSCGCGLLTRSAGPPPKAAGWSSPSPSSRRRRPPPSSPLASSWASWHAPVRTANNPVHHKRRCDDAENPRPTSPVRENWI